MMAYATLTFLGSTLTRSALAAAGIGIAALVLVATVSALPEIGRYTPGGLAAPARALALGQRAARACEYGQAEDALTRALAQGAGAAAWEELGYVYTAREDAARAQLSYANALRLARGAGALPLSGRSLREQIAAESVAEQRDEHGYPRL
jgi:hypothetical protein